jgi:small redox-active disulfide protein 2
MNDAPVTIEVLGPGCARCQETYRVVRQVVEQGDYACTLTKSEAVDRMVAVGVLQTPAIAINGKVVLAGRIPKAEEVKTLLGIA